MPLSSTAKIVGCSLLKFLFKNANRTFIIKELADAFSREVHAITSLEVQSHINKFRKEVRFKPYIRVASLEGVTKIRCINGNLNDKDIEQLYVGMAARKSNINAAESTLSYSISDCVVYCIFHFASTNRYCTTYEIADYMLSAYKEKVSPKDVTSSLSYVYNHPILSKAFSRKRAGRKFQYFVKDAYKDYIDAFLRNGLENIRNEAVDIIQRLNIQPEEKASTAPEMFQNHVIERKEEPVIKKPMLVSQPKKDNFDVYAEFIDTIQTAGARFSDFSPAIFQEMSAMDLLVTLKKYNVGFVV